MSHKTLFHTQSEKELDRILKSKKTVPIFTVDKQINPDSKKKVQTENNLSLDPNIVLTELVKHAKKANKLEIIVKKILILMQEYYASLDYNVLIDLLYEILSQIKPPTCKQELLKIYRIFEENKIALSTLQLLKLKCQTISDLETDDTFEYNIIVKQITTSIQSLKDSEPNNTRTQQYLYDIIEYMITIKQNTAISTIRKQFIYNLAHELKQCQIYIRQFFDETYQTQIDTIVTKFQTDKVKDQIQQQTQIQQSALIQENYLKPNHDVVDCRPLIESNNGLDAWNLKQQGL